MGKVYVVVGEPRTGKDTFIKYCQQYLEQKGIASYKLSTVDNVKEAAKLLGWEGEKTPEGRRFLSDLKDLSSAYCDSPFRSLINKCVTSEGYVFVMMREAAEVKRARLLLGAEVVKLQRLFIDRAFSNHADYEVDKIPADILIKNDADLQHLQAKAEAFIDDRLQEENERCIREPIENNRLIWEHQPNQTGVLRNSQGQIIAHYNYSKQVYGMLSAPYPVGSYRSFESFLKDVQQKVLRAIHEDTDVLLEYTIDLRTYTGKILFSEWRYQQLMYGDCNHKKAIFFKCAITSDDPAKIWNLQYEMHVAMLMAEGFYLYGENAK